MTSPRVLMMEFVWTLDIPSAVSVGLGGMDTAVNYVSMIQYDLG